MTEGPRWFYAVGDERIGPVAEAELRRWLAVGKIPPDTLVWAPGLEQWTPAEQVIDFRPGEEPEPEPATTPPPPPPSRPSPGHPSQLRPWVRYWARMLDLALFSFLVGLALDPVAGDFDPEQPDYAFLAVSFLLVVMLEALSVAIWGTTPGKALLRVRLRRADGTRLDLRQSVQRAFRVFVVGEGMLLPIVTIACMAFSFQRLMGRGLTWWDEVGRIRVEHGEVGLPRALIAGATIALIVWLSYDWSQAF